MMILFLILLSGRINTMNINFENLEKITDILKILQTIQLNQVNNYSNTKRWLSTKELSEYIPFSVETIYKKVQSEEFIYGTHYQLKGKTRIFDREKIDEWILSDSSDNCNNPNYYKKQELIEKISKSIA